MMKMLFLLSALTLAMSSRELQRDFDAPLHSAVTDTPSLAEMTFADPSYVGRRSAWFGVRYGFAHQFS